MSANSGWEEIAKVDKFTVWKHAGGYYQLTKGAKPSTAGGYYNLKSLLKMKGLPPNALGI